MTTAPLSALMRRCDEILHGLRHPPLGMAAALAEECGEVSRLLLDHHAYGGKLDREALGAELSDVLVCLLEIASFHGVDLDAAVLAKLAKIEAKAPRWREELGAALRRATERGSAAPPAG